VVVSLCHSPIGGAAVRVTRMSTFGLPVTGACAQVTSTGWTTATLTDNLTTQNSRYDIRTGGPVACLAVRSKPVLNGVDAVLDFCNVDPDLFGLTTGQTVIDDAVGTSVGFAGDTDTYATGSFALELWTRIAGRAGCVSGLPSYGYLLLPWLVGTIQGPVTHSAGTSTFRISASTVAGHQWGAGPYNVARNASGVPVPLLVPAPATRHRHWQVTTVPPPTAVCGCQTL
jgi:hypothetical protein